MNNDDEHINWGRREDDYSIKDTPSQIFWHSFALRLLTFTVILFAVVTLGYAYQKYEHTLFPVISDFTIQSLESNNGSVEIYGTFNKERECRSIDMASYVVKDGEMYADIAQLKFGDVGTEGRAPILQNYGPWWITIPADFDRLTIDIYTTHSCNFFYNTTTKTASFNIRQSKSGIVLVSN